MSRPARVHVQLEYGLDVTRVRRQFMEGIAPEECAYGFHHAEAFGYSVSYSEDSERGAAAHLIARISKRLLGFDLLHSWQARSKLRQADIVWTMLEREALGVAFLMRLGLVPRRPIIASTVWMIDQWGDYSFVRRGFLSWLTKHWSVMTVHSQACLPVAQVAFPDVPVVLLRFGVSDGTFLRPARRRRAGRPLRIVAAGNDRTRDWRLALAAFGNLAEVELILCTKAVAQAEIEQYANVHLARVAGASDWSRLFADADYLFVPMIENLYSGITVALEGAALGVPVIATRTGGIPTYFSENEVNYVGVGDVEQLRAIVKGQSDDDRFEKAARAQQRYKRDDYSSRGMIRRYAQLTDHIMQERSDTAVTLRDLEIVG